MADLTLARKVLQTEAAAILDLVGRLDGSFSQAVDMVRALKAATGAKGWILPMPFPGALGRALRDGSLIPGPGALHGTQTYADWLRSNR